jgi:phospholipase A1/A2
MRCHRRTRTLPAWRLALPLAACLPAPATAQSAAPPALAQCAEIGAAADRLVCYDALAGRAQQPASPAPAAPPAAGPVAATPTPPTTSRLAATGAPPEPPPRADGNGATGSASLLSKYWELEPSDKRGVFNFVGYQPNFVLPLHYTSRINRAPQSPTQAAVSQPDYRREEAKFQLSLRTKLVQGLPLVGGDLWVAFTQQAHWQIYNGADSKPFRNTDYQPEAIYLLPTAPGLRELPLGWRWRYSQLGLAHQSNGQSDPLSRSWNRVYLAAGFERGDWSFTARFNQRLNESYDSDNNPDLVSFRGRGEFKLNWSSGLHAASLLYRTSLQNRYGALQAEWSYPIFRDQPNGLRWFVQGLSGYGETLTDYNFRQNSLGVGVTFLNF